MKHQYLQVIVCIFIALFAVLIPMSAIPGYSQTKSKAPVQEIQAEEVEKTEAADEAVIDEMPAVQKTEDAGATVTEGENLFATISQGGPLMIFLVILGLLSLTLIIERLIFFHKNKLWNNKQLEEYLVKKSKETEAVYYEDMEDRLKGAFQLYANSMEKGMGLISGIGNLSPIVGFLGTVIGMISAFAAIASATTVNAKVVAVGIQIALVTTAGGLMVAAPALTFYYLFSHIIQNRYAFSDEIISRLCGDLPRLSAQIIKEDQNNV